MIKDINGKRKPCKGWQTKKMMINSVLHEAAIAALLQKEYPDVMMDKLRRVTEYEAPRMRFLALVPPDGGKQADFSSGARPIIQRCKMQEWLQMGVIKKLPWQPTCVGPLLLIPNEKKQGFWICHDLCVLNTVTVKEWGPTMNRHVQMKAIPAGDLFSSFDLSKGFLQIPIPEDDQTHFGFYLWGQFFLYLRGFLLRLLIPCISLTLRCPRPW